MATNMKKQGLYNPDNEHDSCGIGFVANLKNVKSHHIIQQGLKILCNVTHRGAVGADGRSGNWFMLARRAHRGAEGGDLFFIF